MRPGRPNGLGAALEGATTRPTSSPVGRRTIARAILGVALAIASSCGTGSASDGTGFVTALESGMPEDRQAPARGWLSVGILTGSTQFDSGLADYQWNTAPRFGWGAVGLVGRGRLAAGLELWRAGTTQAIGDLGAAPQVHATSAELVGEVLVVEGWGTRLWMRGHGGLMRLGYSPDRITVQPSGPVSLITVDLAPVNTWTVGAGVALRRPLSRRWTLGLGIDSRRFAIDTAHRAGSEIVYVRETFGDWSARCELARVLGRR